MISSGIVEKIAPISNGLGSYTKQLIDGSRLTFTSQIYLPWKFVLIEKKVNS